MNENNDNNATAARSPLVVCWGAGQDSTGMIVGMWERGIRPDVIIFADVGSERPETYAFIPIFERWLASVGFPTLTVVRYQVKNFEHWPEYYTLLENCLTNATLPSLVYGWGSCSVKWKISAINAWLKQQSFIREWWAEGGKVRKCIGFDNTPHEQRRASRGCNTFAVQSDEHDKYDLLYPLQSWGWTREDCVAAIRRVGLPVPPKSSCFFCPSMKPWEVETLGEAELKAIVVLEKRASARHLARAEEDGWPLGVGVPKIAGLWRRPVKGCRGATPRPGSITEFIRQRGLLPAVEIDRIIAATPTRLFEKGDFERLGFGSWQEWLQAIIYPAAGPQAELNPEQILTAFR